MFFLSFILLGKGIHALQETGLVPVTELGLGLRLDMLGVYPFYQTLGAQLALVAFLIAINGGIQSPLAVEPKSQQAKKLFFLLIIMGLVKATRNNV